MPRFAQLFEAADDVLDNFREALRRRDLESLMRLWSDEDSVSCILPNGQRLCGHAQLREAFGQLLNERTIHSDVVETTTQASLGIAIFETIEALRFDTSAHEVDAFVHNTYILMQNHDGWRIAHLHSSPAREVTINTAAMMSHALH